MDAVVHNVEGSPVAYPDSLVVRCEACDHEWLAIHAQTLREVVCPRCAAVTQLAPGVRVKVIKQVCPEELDAILHNIGVPNGNLLSLQLIDTLSRQLTVTCTITAPLTWWMQLGSHGVTWYVQPRPAPFRQEDFAVPLSLDQVDEVNAVAEDPTLLQGHMPASLYLSGLATFTYRQLDTLGVYYEHHPEYEWQEFLRQITQQLEIPGLASTIQGVEDVEL